MEVYNIRNIKVRITKVLYTGSTPRFRLGNVFNECSVHESKYIFVIYSGKMRFIEVGFNSNSVYKLLRYIFRQPDINSFILNLTRICDELRTK